MKTGKRTEQGQAIVLIALSIVVLIAFTGLAIDGGNVFSDRRQAQNAADTAAISSALSLARGATATEWRSKGESIALANGYGSGVTVHLCSDTSLGSCPPPYDGSDSDIHPDEYLHVVIISTVDTFFAPVIGVHQLTNRVESIARAKPPAEMFFGNAMISVCTDGKASFAANGGAATTVTGGGIFVNSDSDDCAFDINGGSGSLEVPSVSVVGEACLGPGETDIGDAGTVPVEGVDQLQPPDYTWLDELLACASAPLNAYTVSGNTLTPNNSTIRVSNKFPPSGVENLGPGVYCLYKGFTITNTGAVLNGTGVTFVLMDGNLTLNGGEIRLSAPVIGNTAGLLFYQPAFNDGSSNNMSITGNAVLELSGTIIAPSVEVAVAGTPGMVIDGQIIGCDVSLSGSSGGAINYDDEKNIDDPPQIELTN